MHLQRYYLDPASSHRPLGQELYMNRILAFTPYSKENVKFHSQTMLSLLTSLLPRNVHLLSLEPLVDNRFLLRLEHFYEKHEGILGSDAVVNKKVEISFKQS